MSSQQSYGKSLPDQVERIASLTDAQLDLLSDVRELYQSRVVLEKEYAGKLQVLANKAAERKTRKIAALVLGSEPTKTWGEDVIKQSTLNQAYSQLISSFLESAQDHVNLAEAFNVEVTESLKVVEKNNDLARKKQTRFFQKLLSDRDRVFSDRAKSKQKYDEECMEVESYRQKQDRAQDDKHLGRAAKQFEQQQIDMHNSKNAYMININIANKVKAKFYEEDIPALENHYQTLQSDLVNRMVKVLLHAQAIAGTHYEKLKNRASSVETVLKKVDPATDQDLFIDYNLRPFSAPADWTFEPCSGHYDTSEMVVVSAPKVVLQNKLVRNRTKLGELQSILDSKRKISEQLAQLVTANNRDNSPGNAEDVVGNFLDASHDLTTHETSERILIAEIEVLDEVLEGDEGEQRPHQFKSASFSIPTHCGYCTTSIWGLSKLGKTCKLCGMSVHAKCELKVPATCNASQGVSGPSTSSISTVSRNSSKASNASSSVPTPSSFARADPTPNNVSARVTYEFVATSPFELSVAEGAIVSVMEEDDGSGWVKVQDSSGGKGLVPASYVEVTMSETALPESTGGALQYVRGVYDYQANGDDELNVKDGEIIQLTPNGKTFADGWWEGINTSGKRGIFPSNYVTLV